MKIDATFLNFLTSEIIQNEILEKKDVEKALHHTGKLIGMKLLEIFEFRRDNDLNNLIYRIVFNLLPMIYETNRKVDRFKDSNMNFIITELNPIFGKFISLPQNNKDFSADAMIAGVIEGAICASGFICKVTAYKSPEDNQRVRTVYYLEIEKPVLKGFMLKDE